jgi:siderophore synthetase component
MELAIINGTYRNGNQQSNQIQLALAAAAATNVSGALNGSPALTSRIIGNPLIMQQQRVTGDAALPAANQALLALQLQQQLSGAQAAAYPQLLQQLNAGAAGAADYQQLLLG